MLSREPDTNPDTKWTMFTEHYMKMHMYMYVISTFYGMHIGHKVIYNFLSLHWSIITV